MESVKRGVVTVDGLGASGKSALARMLADRLGFAHLNSGLLYRATAFLAQRAGLSLDDGTKIAEELLKHSVALKHDALLGAVVLINGGQYEAELMSRRISEAASQVARHQAVRAHLLGIQQTAFVPMGVVAEGRDMGTVVFPEARVKFFVEARLEVRAERRCEQLRHNGQAADREGVASELEARDLRDATRATAPMKAAEGAIIIDNSDTALEETVEHMYEIVKASDLR